MWTATTTHANVPRNLRPSQLALQIIAVTRYCSGLANALTSHGTLLVIVGPPTHPLATWPPSINWCNCAGCQVLAAGGSDAKKSNPRFVRLVHPKVCNVFSARKSQMCPTAKSDKATNRRCLFIFQECSKNRMKEPASPWRTNAPATATMHFRAGWPFCSA